MHRDFPADVFTACITDPLRIYIKWLLHVGKMQPLDLNDNMRNDDTIDEDFAYRLSGSYVSSVGMNKRQAERDLPKGKLRMIFECITDCIAWSVCDTETYTMLFKTDEMVASLFHNFLFAQVSLEGIDQLQRVMSFFNCHPVSKPAFPDLSFHHLWKV